MIINASHILEHVDMTSVLKVVDINGDDAFPADYDRIIELVLAAHVCGHVRGSRLKYLELLVPISEIDKPFREVEKSGSVNARTNLGAYRQHLDDGLSCFSLHFCKALDGAIAA